MSRQAARSWRLVVALCVLVAAADQAIKALVEATLETGEHVDVLGPIALTLSHNSGIAFGLASGGGVAVTAVALTAIAFLGLLLARNIERPGMWLAAGLVAGGALGNLIDRLSSGEVTDYVDILAWPAFNLADAAITIGVVLLALSYARHE